jgi:hypothetical protein
MCSLCLLQKEKNTDSMCTISLRFGHKKIIHSSKLEDSLLTKTQRTSMPRQNSLLSLQLTSYQALRLQTTRCFRADL